MFIENPQMDSPSVAFHRIIVSIIFLEHLLAGKILFL